MSDPTNEAGGPREAFSTVGDELADAIRREVEQVRAELTARLTRAGKGARLLAVAGAFGGISVAAVGSLPLIALRRIMPAWLLAILIGGGSAAIAARLARDGLNELG